MTRAELKARLRYASRCGVCGGRVRSVRLDPHRFDLPQPPDLRWEHVGFACVIAAGAGLPKFAPLVRHLGDLRAHDRIMRAIGRDKSPVVGCIDHDRRPTLHAPARVKAALVKTLWSSLRSPPPAEVRP